MIVSNSRKFIFVHIHKTGGTSITRALSPSMAWNDVYCESVRHGNVIEDVYKTRFGIDKHSRASAIRDVVGRQLWDDYYTFGFVRDPYTRLLSLYTWLGKRLRSQHWKRYVRQFDRKNKIWQWPGMTAYLESSNFSQFIRHPVIANGAEGAPGAQPMTNWLADESGLIVDFVGRQESLAEDFSRLAETLKLGDISLPKLNVSGSKVQLKNFYADQSDLDLIYERYQQDFELFGYERRSYQSLD